MQEEKHLLAGSALQVPRKGDIATEVEKKKESKVKKERMKQMYIRGEQAENLSSLRAVSISRDDVHESLETRVARSSRTHLAPGKPRDGVG